MAVATWRSGFEYLPGVFDILGTTAPVLDTTIVRSGVSSLKCSTVSGSGQGERNLLDLLQKRGVLRVYVRFETLPSALSDVCGFVTSVGSNAVIHYQPTGTLFECVVGAGTVRQSAAISTGRWYCLELISDVSANPTVAAWRIDGVDQTNATLAQAADTLPSFWFGPKITSTAMTCYYDDALGGTAASTSDFFGTDQGPTVDYTAFAKQALRAAA